MREEESDLGLPAAKKSRVGEVYRRERRAFWWACGWLAALYLVGLGDIVFGYIVDKRVAELMLIAGNDYLPDLDGYILGADPWLRLLRISVILLSIGFLVSLACWLRAIHRRKQAETERFLPPHLGV